MTSDGTNTYQWDAEGHMVSVNNGSTWSATYDAFGRRVERISTNGGRTEELYDPSGQLMGHLNGANGVWWEEYVPFDGRVLWYYNQSTNLSRYFHVNALGSLGLATDQTGTPVEEMLYYPFGEQWQNSTGFGWDEKFARFPQHDNDLDLYMASFREYNPVLGRWISPDKLAGNVVNPQSLNRYAYVLNNPVSNIDPLGLQTQTCTNMHPCFSADVVGYLDAGDNVGLLPPLSSASPSSGAGGGGGGGGSGTPSPSEAMRSLLGPMHTCKGQARVLEGNPKTIGRQGAVPGAPVAAGSAAATPSQWGFRNGAGFSTLSVSGTTNVPIKDPLAWVYFPDLNLNPTGLQQHFSGITDVNGGKPPAGYPNVRNFLMSRYPGSLILELVSGKDQNVTTVQMSIAASQGCPAGTVDSKYLQIHMSGWSN